MRKTKETKSNKSNVEWWNKKIATKRIKTSFEKKNWGDKLEFWIKEQIWKKSIKLKNKSKIKNKNQENEDQIHKKIKLWI
jgi:hypothetical protein